MLDLIPAVSGRNPSELRGLCKYYTPENSFLVFSRNPSELRGLCKQW